jgi:hypothetical protein
VASDRVWIGDNLLLFDGEVLEVFGHPASPSARFHVEALDLTLEDPDRKGRRSLTLRAAARHSGGLGLTIELEDLPRAEPFLDRVLAAIPDA